MGQLDGYLIVLEVYLMLSIPFTRVGSNGRNDKVPAQ